MDQSAVYATTQSVVYARFRACFMSPSPMGYLEEEHDVSDMKKKE